jgi:pyruvate dehydrogenase E2 component (dihydrolipoamide acetyltransferase)
MQLDIYLLSQNWKDLVKKSRAKQLQPNEYNSGMELLHYIVC